MGTATTGYSCCSSAGRARTGARGTCQPLRVWENARQALMKRAIRLVVTVLSPVRYTALHEAVFWWSNCLFFLRQVLLQRIDAVKIANGSGSLAFNNVSVASWTPVASSPPFTNAVARADLMRRSQNLADGKCAFARSKYSKAFCISPISA